MRKSFAVVALALLLVALLLPEAASARREIFIGSLAIHNGEDLRDRLIGLAVISNPGLEKTIVQQMPPLVVPVVLDADVEDSDSPNGPPRVLNRNLDTTVLLTNLTDGVLEVLLTVRGADGEVIRTTSVAIPGHGTRALGLTDLLGASQ